MDEDSELRARFSRAGEIDALAEAGVRASVRARMFELPSEPQRMGRFELLDEPPLGCGGMGVVYAALDPERNEMVALKTLVGLDAERLYRLKQEFRSLREITHPHLVELHELHATGSKVFFTMELVEGDDIVEHLHGADEAEVRRTFGQLASAIEALHGARKLHLDIKPSNVRVTPHGRVVLLDFGLVRDLRSTTGSSPTTGTTAGTPLYMSPEQAGDRPVSPASDWYAFGAMLYQVLTGHTPFLGLSISELLRAKQTSLPEPPRELDSTVPEDLDALCIALLQRDPANRPRGDEVLRRLGAPATAPTAKSGAFVGRAAELAVLERALQDVVEQRCPVTVHVSGEPGVGKTSLVTRFIEALSSRRNITVLAGRCFQHESLPYPGFDSFVDALVRLLVRLPALETTAILPRDIHELARLFPVLRRVRAVADAPAPSYPHEDVHESRRRAFAALKELLARLADRRGPLVVFIDDLQWGDVDTARLIGELTRPPDPPQMLFVASFRDDDIDAGSTLARMLVTEETTEEEQVVRKLPLRPLGAGDATQLAADLLGDGVHTDAKTIADESEGNPLLLGELARSAASRPDPRGHRDLNLSNIVVSRILGLPDAMRQLLAVVAVAGVPIDIACACEAAGLNTIDRRTVSRLCQARLLRVRKTSERDALECYHDRIREIVVAELHDDQLRQTHLRVAKALEAYDLAEPAALAMHFRAGGQPHRALDFAIEAAQRAVDAFAFDRAAALFRLALELVEHEPQRRRQLQIQLGDALSNAGRGPKAAEAYLAAVEGAEADEALVLRRRAADRLLRSGHLTRGRALIRDVLASVGMRLPRSNFDATASILLEEARLRIRGLRIEPRSAADADPRLLSRVDVCWAASAGLVLVDPSVASFVPRQLRLALAAGELTRIARALCLHAWSLSAPNHLSQPRSQALLRSARGLAESIGDPYALALEQLVQGHIAMYSGRWLEAMERAQGATDRLREQCVNNSWEINAAQLIVLTALAWAGEIKEVHRRVQAWIRSARERGDLYAVVVAQGNRIGSFGWLAADEPDRAMRELEAARRQWPSHGVHFQHQLFCQAEATILLYADPQTAWRQIVQGWPRRRTVIKRSQFLRLWAWSVRGACAIAATGSRRDSDRASRDAIRAARALSSEKQPFGDALATSLRAGIASSKGRTDDAVRELERAAEQLDRLDMRLWAASTRRQLGRTIGGDEGRHLVEEADRYMAAQQILDPRRMAAVFVPGFD